MLKKLRSFMKNNGPDLFVINSPDGHLQLLTGFSGSAGCAVISQDRVFLFVDGRYHLQAEQEIDPTSVTVIKVGMDTTLQKCLYKKLLNLSENTTKIGLFSTKIRYSDYQELIKSLQNQTNLNIIEYESDTFLNKEEKAPPIKKLKYVPPKISGKTTREKQETIKKYLRENNIDLLLVTNLEEISWLTNLRGDEIPYSSCFRAKAVIFKGKLHIFRDETGFDSFIKAVSPENIYFCPQSTMLATYRKLQKACNNVFPLQNHYISELKAVKTPSELEYIRECFVRTDTVFNRAICWLNQNLEKGINISEKDLSNRIKALFEEEGAVGLSFEPIVASGKNTAIIHYTSPDPEKLITMGELVLLDCGAYLKYGYATDQTRTFLAGGSKAQADKIQKHVYTTVLKALLTGLNMDLTEDITGFDLDRAVREVIEANKPEGFNFSHATGHGIGIPVHEAPPRIGPSESSKTPLLEGMCFTIEPGLYKEDYGGVRLENTVTIENGRIKSLTRTGFDRNLIDDPFML